MNKKFKRLQSLSTAAMLVPAAATAICAQAETMQENTVNETVAVDEIANVQGSFTFDQDTVTPGDRVFNLFGTAATGICAKPAFAFDSEEADYYVNVGGKIAKSYTVNLKHKNPQTRTLLCACATGSATANVEITGIPLTDVLEISEIAKDANTIAVTGADGYVSKLPLQYVLEKDAMIVYSMAGENMVCGTQFWVPKTVAKYFTRNVVSIELLSQEEVPEVEERDEQLRAEVALLNELDGSIKVGQELTFDGYADDLGEPIAAVEFSMDGGKTWTSYATEDAITERWVCWHFSYVPEQAGNYELSIRARTSSGRVSALEATVSFTVEES